MSNKFFVKNKTKYIFEDRYTKIAILITIVFVSSVSYVTVTYNPFLTNEDVIVYHWAGKQIFDGDGKNVEIHNAPVGNAILFALTDDPFIHMRIISILSATGIVLLSYLIASQIFNARVAILTQVFVATYAGLHAQSYQLYTDIVPIFLLFLSFYFITKRELNFNKIIIVGLFVGLSFMIRYQAGIIVIAFLIFFILFTRPRFKNTSLFLIIFLLTISPLIIFNYTTYGTILDSNSSPFILIEWDNVPREWFEDESYRDPFLIAKDGDLFLQNYGNNLSSNLNIIFNFWYNWNNLSILPLIPLIGMVPLFGGIYFLRKSLPKNLMPFIIAFFLFFIILSIANITSPLRLFPPALILPMLSALFFSKITKKQFLIPIIIFIVFVNLADSKLMASWLLYENDSLFAENTIHKSQELYEIAQLLSQEEDIESKYIMDESNIVSYHAKSKHIKYFPPLYDSNLENHITRNDWYQFELYRSNLYSNPLDRNNILDRTPDYLLIEPQETIPKNWSVMYQSEKYVLYKIPK